jgi:two-component sensor histidine kinase
MMKALWARNRKHLLLRLLQFSPLIPLMFNGIIWISVPGPLRGQMLAMRSYQRMEQAGFYMDDTMIREMAQAYIAGVGSSPEGQVEDQSQKLYWIGEGIVMGTDGDGSPLWGPGGEPTPFAWAQDDAMFTRIAETDQLGEMDMYAFALVSGGVPPLVTESERAPELLYTPEEAQLEMLPDEYTWAQEYPNEYSLPPTPTVDPTMIDEAWKIGWYAEARGYGDRAPFPDSILAGGGGSGDERRMVNLMGHATDDGLYATLWIAAQPDMDSSYGNAHDPLSDNAMMGFDPTSPDAAKTLDALARRYSCNVYLLGPVEMECVPLWSAPDNVATAEALARAIDAGSLARLFQTGGATPTDEIAAVLGEGIGTALSTTSGYAASSGVQPDGTWLETPAPTVLVLGASDRLAQFSGALLPDDGPLLNTVRDIRVWLAVNMHWLLNLGIGTLVLTLVISPTAFFYERNMIARQRLVEEMERVQRDAHDKVYNRLSALSKRVEMTSDSISADVARSLGSVAEDIRATVTDLQDILGDTRSRTAEITGVDPLRSQLDHVCRSQAARLGVEVLFEAPDTLPRIASQLGWDLQCVLEEAITNAVRHGGANTVRVSVDILPAALELFVRDNGTGGDVTDIDSLPADSTGLRGMRDRVKAHGGSLDIGSAGDGTTLLVNVPLAQRANGGSEA